MKFLLSSIKDNFDDVWDYLKSDAAKKHFAKECLLIAAKERPKDKLSLVAINLDVENSPVVAPKIKAGKAPRGLTRQEICDMYGVSKHSFSTYAKKLEKIGTVGGGRGRPSFLFSKESVNRLAKEKGWEKRLATPDLQEKAAQHFAETPNT